jgi:hypothetical protein
MLRAGRNTIMNTLRIIALMSTAVLTMGSGGIAKTPSDQGTVTYTPETLDIETASAETAGSGAATDSGTGSNDSLVAAGAAAGQSGPSAPVPATAAEMVGGEGGKALELSLTDDYIQGRYYTGGGLLGFDNATGHIGAYFSDSRDIIGNVGLMTDRIPLFIPGLTMSVGSRGYVALLADPKDDVVALAPGIEGRYGLPYDFPVAVVGNLFYAPGILTLGDAKDVIDIDARVEAEVVPDIVGFIGIREFRFDSDEGPDKKAASEIHVGARFAL